MYLNSVLTNDHLVVERFLETMEIWHVIFFVGTQKPKNCVGDLLCADDRSEIKIILIRTFYIQQRRYGHQVHVETVPV
jgi:hypothetical protein